MYYLLREKRVSVLCIDVEQASTISGFEYATMLPVPI